LLDGEGHLTEGATSNCFLVDDGHLRTPTLEGPVLPGVTRAVVIELARALDIPVETGRIEPAALAGAEEAFLTNSTWELRPLAALEWRDATISIGGGPVTDRLRAAFDAMVEERHYDG
jgi:branched-chain amino acid aminotransferase